MAFPIGALIGAGASDMQSGSNPAGYGGVRDDIFSKILGPLAPQFYINAPALRAEKNRQTKREDQADALQQAMGKENIKASQANRAAQERSQGLTGVQMLANQRSTAMQNFNDRTFKNAYWRS